MGQMDADSGGLRGGGGAGVATVSFPEYQTNIPQNNTLQPGPKKPPKPKFLGKQQ